MRAWGVVLAASMAPLAALAQAPAHAPAPVEAPSSLERAYLRELAVLKAEKVELERRSVAGEAETARVLSGARAELERLEAELAQARRAAEAAEDALRAGADAQGEKVERIRDALERAASVTGVAAPALEPNVGDAALGEALGRSLATVADALAAQRAVRAEAGRFFGPDGAEHRGTVVRVGAIAAYGADAALAGALVPAGQGQLAWVPVPAEAAARALAAGQSPAELPLLVVASLDEHLAAGRSVDVSKEVEAANAADDMNSNGLVAKLMGLPIFHAEWVLYLLIALSVVSVAVMVERLLFFRRHRVDIDAVRLETKRLLDRGDFAGAAAYLARFDSLETNVVLFGLREHGAGPDSVEDLLRGAEAKERLRYHRRLSFLATVGSNSPFIGLFGTVLGIIRAFGDMGKDTGAAGGVSVMSGISEALIATAVGLLVAIPAVIAYNAFTGRVKTVLANSELLSRTFLSALKAHDGAARVG